MEVKNNYQAFTQQFTKWLPKSSLSSIIEDLKDSHHYHEGIDYFVKSNAKKVKPRYAVFVRKENKFQRRIDKVMLNNLMLKNITFLDLVMLSLPFKQAEISIFDTMRKRF